MAAVWKSPVVRLAAYYALLVLAVALLVSASPLVRSLLSPGPLGLVSDVSQLAGGGRAAAESDLEALGPRALMLLTLFAMVGALVLALPVAWVYMITKQRQGYDQSVVHTVIMLPMAVAGIVILVRNSLALAFALAAIVAAVRFRNTLKDTKDAVYIFLALGIGVASGVQAFPVAAVMSVVFNIAILLLWWLNVGNLYADQRGLTGRLKLADALAGPGGGPSLAVGDPTLLAALTPDELSEVADRSARLQEHIAARVRAKKKPYNALLLVHAAQPEPAQRSVEEVLDDQTKRWKLVEILPGEGGHSTLEYLVRMRKDVLPTALLDELRGRGAPHVVAAEFKSLKGTTKES